MIVSIKSLRLYAAFMQSSFLRISVLANIIIVASMLPQFLVVPLILNHWGEQSYASYVGFLAIINIITGIGLSLQNGFILNLLDESRFSLNSLISMAGINLLVFVLSVLILFGFEAGILRGIEVKYFAFIIAILPIILAVNSFKLIFQMASSILSPLMFSLIQSTLTLGFFVLFIWSDRLQKDDLICAYNIAVSATFLLSLFYLARISRNFTVEKNFSGKNIRGNFLFIARFGGWSLLVSVILQLFVNGSKVFLDSNYEASILLAFNLSFTLCMVAVQFINPILGLIFPYLAKQNNSKDTNFRWLINIHKIFWMVIVAIYIGYVTGIDLIIRLWIGEEYAYLSEYVIALMVYFAFNEAASINMQFLKFRNLQNYTFISCLICFVALPAAQFMTGFEVTVKNIISLFCISSFAFYVLLSSVVLISSKASSEGVKSYFLDAFIGGGFLSFILVSFNAINSSITAIGILAAAFLMALPFWLFLNPIRSDDLPTVG